MDMGVDQLANLVVRRPDVLEIDVLAVLVLAQRLVIHVAADRALQRIGDHQRRRGEIVGAAVGRHAPFEVAVARQDRRRDQIIVVDRRADLRSKRPRIADAGGAAIADQVEADGVQILAQPGGVEIVGHDLASGREAGLDPWLAGEAQRPRLAGDEPGGDQHRRVGGVGAAGDRGDHHVAIADVELLALDRITVVAALLVGALKLGVEHLVDVGQANPVLRPLGAGERRLDRRHVEVQHVGEQRIGRRGVAPHALRLRIGTDQLDPRIVAAGQLEVIDGPLVDREEAAGRAIFGRHVGDGRPVRQRQRGEARPEEFDEAADHALGAEHLRHGQHQVGGGDAFLEFARKAEADDFGDQHRHRLAKHRGLGLDPADAPAEHAEAVDHRRVAVGPDQRVGIGDLLAILVGGRPDRLGDMLQVDLVADAGAGRHDLEIVERRRAPFEELVALGIALIFKLDILLERARRPEFVDHHAMIDDQVDRHLRIDLLGVAAEATSSRRASRRGRPPPERR